jgi:hypothetical protein
MSSGGAGIWPWSRSGLGTVLTESCLKSPASMKRRFDEGAGSWLPRWRTAQSIEFGCRVAADHGRKKLGRQSFRVEEAFSSGQIGSRVMPELALESACCLALSDLLAQSTPLREILRLQVSGAKGMLLAGGRDQSDAATRQEHGRGYLTAARAPLVIPR